MGYDRNNIFARILRGEVPCRKVLENEHALAFHDINPQMPVHVLVIPKGPYVTLNDMVDQAAPEMLAGFWRTVAETARMLGVEEKGYRLLVNNGGDANQEVPHLHVHIFGGRPIRGRMISPEG